MHELVVEMAQSSEPACRPSSDFFHLKASAATAGGLQEHACTRGTGRLAGKHPIIPRHVQTGRARAYNTAQGG